MVRILVDGGSNVLPPACRSRAILPTLVSLCLMIVGVRQVASVGRPESVH